MYLGTNINLKYESVIILKCGARNRALQVKIKFSNNFGHPSSEIDQNTPLISHNRLQFETMNFVLTKNIKNALKITN